jgi:transposase
MLRPRVMLPRRVSNTATRAAEASGRQLQRLDPHPGPPPAPTRPRVGWTAVTKAHIRAIADLELTIVRHAKRHDADAFHRLRSVPGIGKVLALTILYEIHDVTRFDPVQQFASYARLVKCAHESAGKKLGSGGAKQGNVHLKWAFSEAAVLYLRHGVDGKKLLARLERKHGKGKALSILAHKIGRAVYILARGTVFSQESQTRDEPSGSARRLTRASRDRARRDRAHRS